MNDELAKLLEIRNWLGDAAKAKGANVEGAGIGVTGADFDFNLNGRRYWVTITEIVEEEERRAQR